MKLLATEFTVAFWGLMVLAQQSFYEKDNLMGWFWFILMLAVVFIERKYTKHTKDNHETDRS